MSTITAQTLIDRARLVLNDPTATRWSDAELLGWLNDGQRTIVSLRPDTASKLANITTVDGTLQSIPGDGYSLLSVVRNMGSDGITPGTAVREVARGQMDTILSTWHAAASSPTTLHYIFDPRMPKRFYVYPPSQAGQRLEILYAANPTDVTAGQPIWLDDIYAEPLLDALLYRAYSKDAEIPEAAARAVAHRQAMENALGLKAQADAATSPAGKTDA